MRLMLLCAAATLLVTSIARAEPRTTRPDREGPGMQMLQRIQDGMIGELKLSEEQKSKVDAIFSKAREELASMRQQLESAEPRERMERVGEFFRGLREDL